MEGIPFLRKPFQIDELKWQVRALLRPALSSR